VDPVVVAPVLSQPSLPLPIGRQRRAALALSSADRTALRQRAAEGLCVMGLRFSTDTKSPPERFDTLRRELGDRFLAVEIDASPGNPWGYGAHAHSVLTEDYSDASGSPTRRALEEVLAFLDARLRPPADGATGLA